MYFNSFQDILNNECAHCSKSFGEGNQRILPSTTLKFTDFDFSSSLIEDITNFQAISYIYGVSPSLLETSIKNHLINLVKDNENEGAYSAAEEEGEINDPLSSFNLKLCRNCSRKLAVLYTAFCKFEKPSNKKSIIAKGIKYCKENVNCSKIKLEDSDLCNSELFESANNFIEDNNEDKDSKHSREEELESIKEEELESVSEHLFNEPNSNSDGEEHNYNAEETENAEKYVPAELKTNDNIHSRRTVTRRQSARKSRKGIKEIPIDEKCNEDDESENAGSSDYLSSEASDWSDGDGKPNYSKSKSGKRKLPFLPKDSKRRLRKKSKNDLSTSPVPKSSETIHSSNNNTKDYKDFEKLSIRRARASVLGVHSNRCIACKIYFSKLVQLQNHYQIRHNISCEDKVKFKKWLDICAEQSYNCDVCDEFFISKVELDIHLISHSEDKDSIIEDNEAIKGPPFSCPKCPTNSSNYYGNWRQMQLHGYTTHKVAFTNQVQFPKTYFCKICEVPFITESPWVSHMNQIHRLTICKECFETFPDTKSLQLHIDKSHAVLVKSKNGSYNCENCDITFPNIPSLWMHTLVHIVEGNEKIQRQTFEKFATSMTYCDIDKDTNDLTTDSNLCGQIFSCMRCEKRFKSFYAMKIHQFVHTIQDFDKLESKSVIGRQFICPVCAIDCKRNIILRKHCLIEHNIIISTDSYPREQFLKELIKEKEDCDKRAKRVSSIGCTKSKKYHYHCQRCSKVFRGGHYRKQAHRIAQEQDISIFEKAIYTGKGRNIFCPKCGIDFPRKVPGPLKLKVHCLQQHNLIVSRNQVQLEEYTKFLLKEKEYCNEHKTLPGLPDEVSSNRNSNSSDQVVKNNSDKRPCIKTSCNTCNKVFTTDFAIRVHELAHSIDLTTVKVENMEETHQFQCPRCQTLCSSNFQLLEHCLGTHNVVVSTKNFQAEKFLQLLAKEQKSIQISQKNAQNVLRHNKKDENKNSTLDNHTDTRHHNETTLHTEKEATEKESSQISRKIDGENTPESETESSVQQASRKCTICNMNFFTKRGTHNHFLKHFDLTSMEVKIVQGPQLACPECAAVHLSILSLREHCVSVHGFNVTKDCQDRLAKMTVSSSVTENSTSKDLEVCDDSTNFVCNICGKMFTAKNKLNAHKICHQTESNFVCDRCGASFKHMNLFRMHKRVHLEKDNGIRPSCNICGKDFISSRKLFTHKSHYHPKKKLICPVCNKTFASNRYAAQHIRKHTAATK